MIEVIQGDCLDIMPTLGKFDCVFMDPPDNIRQKYDGSSDSVTEEEYILFLIDVLYRAMALSPVTWISFNAKWLPRFGGILYAMAGKSYCIKPCVQTFTFCQHNQHDFGNGHRPLWRIAKTDAPFYADNVRVPSWRQQNGDERADPRGRVPDDVFRFPRVTGNSKQRRAWHPTQLHEGLVERCILSCTKPGDRVLDPFAGTGTTGRVCQRIGRECVLIDQSLMYCAKMREEFEG